MSRIQMASEDRISELRPYVRRLLKAIGFEEAWVSDESCIGDFPLDEEDIPRIAQELGVPVDLQDYVFEVAERMRDMERNVVN